MLSDDELQAIADKYVRAADPGRAPVEYPDDTLEEPAGCFFVPTDYTIVDWGFRDQTADGEPIECEGVFVTRDTGAVRPVTAQEWNRLWQILSRMMGGPRRLDPPQQRRWILWHLVNGVEPDPDAQPDTSLGPPTIYMIPPRYRILDGRPYRGPQPPWWKFWE